MRTVLDAYEEVVKANPNLKPGTLVVEHAFLADETQRQRAIRLGVSVTVQHPLLYALGAQLLAKWGKERTAKVMPISAWVAEGAQVSAGSDSPPSSPDPLLSVWGGLNAVRGRWESRGWNMPSTGIRLSSSTLSEAQDFTGKMIGAARFSPGVWPI